MTGMLPNVPYGADQTLYLVMDTVGPRDLKLQNPVERPDLDSVIDDLLLARFNNPVGIYAFNTLEHWTADISKNVAEEIQCRCDILGDPVPPHLKDFVANSLRERTSKR
ncbi:MAG: hypothetical protein J0H42_20040 [Rhizobiales bacterium]|nr:hypothetical protein [Hyphomicrobiales bacterium]